MDPLWFLSKYRRFCLQVLNSYKYFSNQSADSIMPHALKDNFCSDIITCMRTYFHNCISVEHRYFRVSKKSLVTVVTDRVHSTTGRLCFDRCLSVCPHLGGVPWPGPDGGGVPQPGPAWGGTPYEGYPDGGTPPRVHPAVRPGQGDTPPWVPPLPPLDLAGRYPTSGTPHRTWPGGYPNGGGTPPRVVLDTPRSVCLLRSRRRTFLVITYLDKTKSGFLLDIENDK